MSTTHAFICLERLRGLAGRANLRSAERFGPHGVASERAAEAAGSFERCIELNPDMSKAWQLCGEAMEQAGWADKAAAVAADRSCVGTASALRVCRAAARVDTAPLVLAPAPGAPSQPSPASLSRSAADGR